MADEYRGKSNEQIINEQAASLEAKSHYQNSARFNPAGETVTSMESGVSESGVEGFPTTRGMEQVSVGRTGQTGGGAKDQWISPQEGGDDRTGGNPSRQFEGDVESPQQ